MKKLYYTVEKQLQDVDGFEETTGWKTITVYSVKNNEIENFFDLEVGNSSNSEAEILEWLDSNGYGDKTIRLTIL